MTSEDPRIKSLLWWVASIAASVVCCSALFVLFANYLIDVKSGLKDVDARMAIMEQRSDTILTSIDSLRAKVTPVPAATATEDSKTVTATESGGISLDNKNTNGASPAAPAANGPVAGELAPAAAPAVPAAPVAEAPATPAIAVPTISAPSMAPPASDKK